MPGGAVGLVRVRGGAAFADASGCVRRERRPSPVLPGVSSACRGGGLRRSAGSPGRSASPTCGEAEHLPSLALRGVAALVRASGRRPPLVRRGGSVVVRARGAAALARVRGEAARTGVSGGRGIRPCAGAVRVLLRARGSGPRRRFRETRSSSIAGAAAFAGVPGRFGAPARAGKRPAPVLQGNAVLAHVSGRRPRRFAGAVRCSSMSGLGRDGQASFVTSEDGGSALPGRERTSSVHS